MHLDDAKPTKAEAKAWGRG